MMTGEEVEASIIEYLREQYPEGPRWQDPQFHCLEAEPLQLKMIPAFERIEYNLDNGGWAQLLWNCIGTWRRLLEIAAEGYALIGAEAQREALKPLSEVLSRDEAECARYLQRVTEENASEIFSDYTRRSYAAPGNEWEQAFYYDSGINELRLAWLEAHAEEIQALLCPDRSFWSRWKHFMRKR
ncbi:DMP19 family protein [Gimesia panareensis]|uniref:DMP19 family protein n=1 Tax=Gimesia panareensis TaxID=2527978 RepID=UPI00119F779E|nr:DUF4375 domain-containing protein [Gimesia panareensis]